MKRINLAVDVMGGDKGPITTIEGIYKASKIFPKVHFRLFGDKQKVFDELNKFSSFKNFEFFHTDEVVKSEDGPVDALRKLKKSSLRLLLTM